MNLCHVDKIWISVSKSFKFIWILCFEYFGDVDYNAGFIFSLEAKPAGAQGAKAMFQKMDNAAPKPKYVDLLLSCVFSIMYDLLHKA